jgi:hypothetical protein
MVHRHHFILNSRLPAQERIGLSGNDIPGVGRVGLVRSYGGYIPRLGEPFRRRVCEGGDIHHFRGGLARPPVALLHTGTYTNT